MAEVGASNYQSIWINIIQPDQEHRVESLVKWTRLWRKFQNVFEAFARLLFLAGAVLSYASGVYENKVLAFVAGTVITTAIAINQFSIYAGKESAERKTELIQLLNEIRTLHLEEPNQINVDNDV